jgi:hypothetical protein
MLKQSPPTPGSERHAVESMVIAFAFALGTQNTARTIRLPRQDAERVQAALERYAAMLGSQEEGI